MKINYNFLKQWKLIFNISVNRNGEKLTVSRKMVNILTVSRKKTKILTVSRKSHHPVETLLARRNLQAISLLPDML